jgi:hypothetical protein
VNLLLPFIAFIFISSSDYKHSARGCQAFFYNVQHKTKVKMESQPTMSAAQQVRGGVSVWREFTSGQLDPKLILQKI